MLANRRTIRFFQRRLVSVYICNPNHPPRNLFFQCGSKIKGELTANVDVLRRLLIRRK